MCTAVPAGTMTATWSSPGRPCPAPAAVRRSSGRHGGAGRPSSVRTARNDQARPHTDHHARWRVPAVVSSKCVLLKALTLKGFKSFAEATTLEFEPGVMVVVGPNGSGKSNVVDAVAWVLGAQGPSTVRSGKMEDVIFAGTASRPALGRAEVSLTIDNASGTLPIELAEVTITRTLFRSGDSEYAINGAPCRLLDVQDLLSDSGVGRQQHM